MEKAARSNSGSKQKELTKSQVEVGCSNTLGLGLEMVDRIMEQIEAIRIVLGADRHTSHLVPSWQDCDVMSSIMKALKPLKDMTDALCGEQSVTISAVLPLLEDITSNLLMPTDDDTNLTKEMKQRVQADWI